MKTSTILLLVGGAAVVWYFYNKSATPVVVMQPPTVAQTLATGAVAIAGGLAGTLENAANSYLTAPDSSGSATQDSSETSDDTDGS